MFVGLDAIGGADRRRGRGGAWDGQLIWLIRCLREEFLAVSVVLYCSIGEVN